MARIFFVLALFTVFPTAIIAQDMPLSQILIDGEGRKKVEGNPKERRQDGGVGVKGKWADGKETLLAELMTGGAQKMIVVKLGTQGMYAVGLPDAIKELAGMALSSDGSTLYLGDAAGRYIWAFTVGESTGLSAGASYCPVRLPPDKKTSQLSGLTTDRDGRIYAATDIGVQVFDPTGRLCGVLTPAAPGKPEHLAFEGDKLTLWIGDTKYARKLSTAGAK